MAPAVVLFLILQLLISHNSVSFIKAQFVQQFVCLGGGGVGQQNKKQTNDQKNHKQKNNLEKYYSCDF